MKVSLKWLNEYVEVPTDIKAFCDKLDLDGHGRGGRGDAWRGLRRRVVGHVLTCEPHPDSDHMHVCRSTWAHAEGRAAADRLRRAEHRGATSRCPWPAWARCCPATSRSRSPSCAALRAAACAARKRELGLGARPLRHLGASRRRARWASPSRSHGRGTTPCSTWRSPRTARTACPWWAWPARWAPCTVSDGADPLPMAAKLPRRRRRTTWPKRSR